MRLDVVTNLSREQCRARLEAALAAEKRQLRGYVGDDGAFRLHDWLGPHLGTVVVGEIRPLQSGAHISGYVGIGQAYYLIGIVLLLLGFVEAWLLAVGAALLVALWALFMRRASGLRTQVERLFRDERSEGEATSAVDLPPNNAV